GDTPVPPRSGGMAAVSDVLPSPGAPTTAGTTACTGPSRARLPVVAPGCAAAGCLAAAVRLGSAAGCALTLVGCAAKLEANDPWPLWVGSQATKELAALPAIDCATWGVKAAHGSLAAPAETTSSPVMRFTRLPVGSVTSQM